jgi:hypothetical protein
MYNIYVLYMAHPFLRKKTPTPRGTRVVKKEVPNKSLTLRKKAPPPRGRRVSLLTKGSPVMKNTNLELLLNQMQQKVIKKVSPDPHKVNLNANNTKKTLAEIIRSRKNNNKTRTLIEKTNIPKKYRLHVRMLQDNIRAIKKELIEIQDELNVSKTKENIEYLKYAIEVKNEEMEQYESEINDIKMGKEVEIEKY